MKRWIAMAMALCLLACTASVAGAEGEAAPLRVMDGWWAMERYQQLYPDRKVEELEHFETDGWRSIVEQTALSGEWDAMCVDTTEVSLAELDQMGLLLDLGSVEATAAQAAGLYPSIRAGCSVGEKLVALPAGYIGTRAPRYRLLGTDYIGGEDAEGMALLAQLGFTAEDQPTNFAQVCELGLRYMALSRETRKGTMFLWSDSASQGFVLLYNMVLTYLTEATDESGHTEFDTPAFRAALQAADPLLAAFKADPKRTYGKNNELRVVLCNEIGVEQSYGSILHVTESTDFPANMTVVIINPNSPRLSEAIDFAMAAATSSQDALLLYQNADYDALLRQSYDDSIAAQIAENEDRSVIDELEALKEAGDDKYFTSRRVIEHYATEIQPHLIFPRWHSIPMDTPLLDYVAGKLDADGLIAALNAADWEYR